MHHLLDLRIALHLHLQRSSPAAVLHLLLDLLRLLLLHLLGGKLRLAHLDHRDLVELLDDDLAGNLHQIPGDPHHLLLLVADARGAVLRL